MTVGVRLTYTTKAITLLVPGVHQPRIQSGRDDIWQQRGCMFLVLHGILRPHIQLLHSKAVTPTSSLDVFIPKEYQLVYLTIEIITAQVKHQWISRFKNHCGIISCFHVSLTALPFLPPLRKCPTSFQTLNCVVLKHWIKRRHPSDETMWNVELPLIQGVTEGTDQTSGECSLC